MATHHDMSAPGYRVLAALLLADRRPISSRELLRITKVTYIPHWVRRLKRDHKAPIDGASARPRAYRLTDIPPDCCLDGTLAAAHELKDNRHQQEEQHAAERQ